MAVLPAVMSSSTRAYKSLPLISCSRFLVAGPRWGSGTAHGPGVSRSPPGARTVSPSPCCARGCVRLRTTTTGVAELGGRIRFGRDPSAGVPSSVRRRPSTSLEGGVGRTAGVEDDRATLDHPLDEGAIQTVGERTLGRSVRGDHRENRPPQIAVQQRTPDCFPQRGVRREVAHSAGDLPACGPVFMRTCVRVHNADSGLGRLAAGRGRGAASGGCGLPACAPAFMRTCVRVRNRACRTVVVGDLRR